MSVVLQNVRIYLLFGVEYYTLVLFKILKKIVGLIDCCLHEKNAIKLKHALDLYQSVQARLWSTSPYISRQLDGIGPQFAKNLAKANLITMDQLRDCDPGRIEMVYDVVF